MLRRIAPRILLSSVVRAELTQGARGAQGRRLVAHLTARLERVGRILLPSHADWLRAGEVQSMIWDARADLRTKSMLHDILIASSARQIGACIVTSNEADFATIDRWIRTRRMSTADLTRPVPSR
jgi:predicted nucleic acid-binding protein